VTQDKQIAKLEKKITDLKVMKKSARSLQKKRIKLKIKLSDIKKSLRNISLKVSRFANKTPKIKE
jgi:hypothetical protein